MPQKSLLVNLIDINKLLHGYEIFISLPEPILNNFVSLIALKIDGYKEDD